MKKLYTELELRQAVDRINTKLDERLWSKQFDKPPVFICILNGAFMFFTDLVKHRGKLEIDFIRPKSYSDKEQGDIDLIMDVQTVILDRDIVLVDDIYDSGKTMNFLIQHLLNYGPKSITPVTLFKKWYSNNDELIYGIELKEEFWLTGYGLDHSDGTQRNLPYILGEIHED